MKTPNVNANTLLRSDSRKREKIKVVHCDFHIRMHFLCDRCLCMHINMALGSARALVNILS